VVNTNALEEMHGYLVYGIEAGKMHGVLLMPLEQDGTILI
jgi:hypothetical protein